MEDESWAPGEEHEILELFSKSALNDYPNPERTGCPGANFLKRLATNRKSIPISDPRLSHVVHCSPCFREFTQFKNEPRNRSQRRNLMVVLGGIAALLIIGVWLTNVPTQSKSGIGKTAMMAELNLQDRSIVRGLPNETEKEQLLQIPHGNLKLTVLLPFGSEAGTYEVQILRDVQRPLITSPGHATIIDGTTRLNVGLDTSELPIGQYLIGVHRLPFDWTYNKVFIK